MCWIVYGWSRTLPLTFTLLIAYNPTVRRCNLPLGFLTKFVYPIHCPLMSEDSTWNPFLPVRREIMGLYDRIRVRHVVRLAKLFTTFSAQ